MAAPSRQLQLIMFLAYPCYMVDTRFADRLHLYLRSAACHSP